MQDIASIIKDKIKLYGRNFPLEYNEGVARINIIKNEIGAKFPNNIEVIVTQIHKADNGEIKENIFNIEFDIWPDGEPAAGQTIIHADICYLPYFEPIISKKDKMEILNYIMENKEGFGLHLRNDK